MTKNSIFSLSFFTSVILCGFPSCENQVSQHAITPSYSGGSGYSISRSKHPKQLIDSFLVNIRILNKDETLFKETASLTVGCKTYDVSTGIISLRLEKMDFKTQIKVKSVGFFTVETEPKLFSPNDSITLDIIMAEDDRPLLNCELKF